MKAINLLVFCIYFFLSLPIYGQGIRNIKIDESANGKSLISFLKEIEKNREVDFIFDKEIISPLIVTGVSKGMYFNTYLNVLLEFNGLRLVNSGTSTFFIIEEALKWEYGSNEAYYIAFDRRDANEQLISGVVKDKDTEEPIVGAQVVILETGSGILTDLNGYFQLKVPEGVYQLDIRFVGFETASYIIGFSPQSEVKQLDVSLLQSTTELEGVTVTAEGLNNNIQSLLPGVEKMGIKEIKTLPPFLGEIDPVKSLTTLPGVSTVGELSSGFNVRGGESGQNLILQDGAIIYNPTHLFGFFSAFNPDIVSDVALYKGGGPARFGGRISSVLDVKLKNGDAARHTVTGGVGLVSSRLGMEGPIIRNKASYIVGGRISYSNWLLKATDNIQLLNSSAQFHDITAKIFYRINESNFLSISGYRSYDDFRLASDSTFSWGTTNASIRWDHTFNENLLSTISLSTSNYFSEIFNAREIDAFLYRNAINNILGKVDFFYNGGDYIEYNFGLEANKTKIEPGKLDPISEDSNMLPVNLNDQNVLESAVYWQGDFELSSLWALSAGIRYSHFFRLGQDEIFSFDYSNLNGRYPAVVDTLHYGRGDLIENYGGLAPRISLRYLINESSSLKASYFRTYQYLHLISNTTSATPQDYWVASGSYLKPEIGDQVSLGYFKNFEGNRYEVSVEGFYKETANAIDYIEGADISLNPLLEAGLVSGKGLAGGVELLARKNSGTFSGWVSYTYSRSLRQFKSENPSLDISGGNYYPASFDQPHNLSVILNYKLGSQSTLSTNFSYSTGRPMTIPVSKFSYDGFLSVLNYSSRNEYRLPDYHRLDISLTIEGKPRRNSRFKGDWVFSVYNVYGRKNAYSIFFNKYGTASKLSILGSIFPSVSYNFSF